MLHLKPHVDGVFGQELTHYQPLTRNLKRNYIGGSGYGIRGYPSKATLPGPLACLAWEARQTKRELDDEYVMSSSGIRVFRV